jgi:hypothetical protein
MFEKRENIPSEGLGLIISACYYWEMALNIKHDASLDCM